jgi:hypothetical protein
MARPKKNTVDYFPHYISEGKKIFIIEGQYGNDGYAVWFKILERLAKAENHYINLNDENELLYLSTKCHLTTERLISILDLLAKLDIINKDLWAKKIIWNQEFINSIQDVYNSRKSKCMDLPGLLEHLSLHEGVSGLETIVSSIKNTQSKVKETKLNETKQKETTAKEVEVYLCDNASKLYRHPEAVTLGAPKIAAAFFNLMGRRQAEGNPIEQWKPYLFKWLAGHGNLDGFQPKVGEPGYVNKMEEFFKNE